MCRCTIHLLRNLCLSQSPRPSDAWSMWPSTQKPSLLYCRLSYFRSKQSYVWSLKSLMFEAYTVWRYQKFHFCCLFRWYELFCHNCHNKSQKHQSQKSLLDIWNSTLCYDRTCRDGSSTYCGAHCYSLVSAQQWMTIILKWIFRKSFFLLEHSV